MDYEVRKFELKDATSISELSRDELGYDFPLEETKNKLKLLLKSEEDRVYVAVHNEKVVGYIHACTYELIYAPTMKNIMGIAVSSAYRKKGIGRALLNEIELWGKESGAHGIRLVSGSTRTDAHVFYENCGYEFGKTQYNFKKIFSH